MTKSLSTTRAALLFLSDGVAAVVFGVFAGAFVTFVFGRPMSNSSVLLFDLLAAGVIFAVLRARRQADPAQREAASVVGWINSSVAESSQRRVLNQQSVALEHQIEMLRKLAELKESGILTDEEFAAQKQKILAQMSG